MIDIKLGIWVQTPDGFQGVIVQTPSPTMVVIARCSPGGITEYQIDPCELTRLAGSTDIHGMDPISEESPINIFIDTAARLQQLELLNRHLSTMKECQASIKRMVREQLTPVISIPLSYGTDLHQAIDSILTAAGPLSDMQKELREMEEAATGATAYRYRFADAVRRPTPEDPDHICLFNEAGEPLP